MAKRYFLLILIPALIYVLYWGNIKPLLASQAFGRGDIIKVLSYHTFVSYEARKVTAKQALGSGDAELAWFAKEQMEQNIKERPFDCRAHITLSYLYYRFGETEKAQRAVRKAIELAPNRADLKQLLIDVGKQ